MPWARRGSGRGPRRTAPWRSRSAAGPPWTGPGPARPRRTRRRARANSAWAALRMARQSMEPARPDGAWPMNTFSATLRSGNRRGSWWTTAMPRARDWAGPWIATGVPSRRIVPASGWWTPARILTSVLLPAPFSPTSAWISPGRRSIDTSVSAAVAPNRLLIPCSSTRGGCGIGHGCVQGDGRRVGHDAASVRRASSRPARRRRPGGPRPPSRRAARPCPPAPRRR